MASPPESSADESAIRKANPEGAVWHRWDPHIHAPGTLKNDNFGAAATVFDDYIAAINACNPPIRALGVTDYYVLSSYEKLKARHDAGDLPGVDFIFPNIELRFAVNAGKGSPINLHLLVCPDDPDHLDQMDRFLRELKFDFNEEKYGCTKDELIRLGRAYNPDVENDAHALKLGVEQSKIEPRNLREAFKNSQWARQNILIALPASKNDGAAQLQEDGLKALREELQRWATIIFSGNPKDRAYWCGAASDSVDVLKEKYGGPKPCLHGCDAHDLAKVGNPDENRYCWIRGDVAFDTLRQICFEPALRVFVGAQPPTGGRASNTIKNVEIKNAPWLKTSAAPINSGLVAVIGARGSGKTALVEMIAAGAESVDSTHTKRSFLKRAKDYLVETISSLTWGNGEVSEASAHIDSFAEESDAPRVRYLSQQFVDQLCSSDGLADELVHAIEDVIFGAHPQEERLGAATFKELRELKTESLQRQMERHRDQLRDIGQEIAIQDDLRRSLPELRRKRDAEKAAIDRLKQDRKGLTPSNNKAILDRLEAVRNAAETKAREVAALERKQLRLNDLKNETAEFQDNEDDIRLGQLKIEYAEAGLTDDQWLVFKLKHEGDVITLLDGELKKVADEIKKRKGPVEGEASEVAADALATAPAYFPDTAVLADLTYTLLSKEQRRLEAKIGVDEARRRRYADLSKKIAQAESALVQRGEEIKNAEAAEGKINEFSAQRQKAYCSLVAQIEREEKTLKELYKPLQDRLDAEAGTLNKLSFSVRRVVDIDSWADAGERLIDKSRQGKFRGVGELTKIIKEKLEIIWKTGTSTEIAQAMADFRSEYAQEFWKHAFQDALKTREGRKHWFEQVSEWLYSTDHVSVTYGLEYETVDIEQLSPGTRGIVLLLLYLSIDVDDERPLIIDQPEENLDPKSIFDELVERFKEAKTRRQIIIVTHNANIVVNADADQVIVAERGAHKPKALPDITYQSGSLENPIIRAAVCEILEGGEEAFAERARRLRVRLGPR